MSDLFTTANDFIERMRGSYATREVTYARGSYTLTVDATLGSTSVETDGVDALSVRSRIADFLIVAADLVDVNGAILTPRLGDEIRTTLEGVLCTYRTKAIIEEQVCWKWSDVYHKCRRIHTVMIGGDK